MTTITDNGLEWLSDAALGFNSEEIDAIAVGTGAGNEGTGATSLTAEEYRADQTSEDVVFIETDATGAFEAIITVTGDQEVPAGTEITEIAVFAGETDANPTMIVIDEFAAVTIENGHTEEFTIPIDITR